MIKVSPRDETKRCVNRATRSSASRQGLSSRFNWISGRANICPLRFHWISRFGYTFTVNFLLNSSLSSWLILLYPNSTRLQRYPIHWVPIWAIYHLLWYVRDVDVKVQVIHFLLLFVSHILLWLLFFPLLVWWWMCIAKSVFQLW